MDKYELTRECPTCGKRLFYTTKKIYTVQKRKNSNCKNCSNALNAKKRPKQNGRKMPQHVKDALKKGQQTESFKEKLRKNFYARKIPPHGGKGKDCVNYGRVRSRETREKMSKSKMGKPHSPESRKKISEAQIGRKHTEETKIKQRLSKIKYIEENNGGIRPCHNVKSIEYFTNLELDRGWNGMFAVKNKEFFIKELGYFIDYYEPNLNIVIEYDEKLHYNVDGSLKQKDINRMNSIKNLLKCKFFRYNEKTEELKEY